jgi:hypothetical protein
MAHQGASLTTWALARHQAVQTDVTECIFATTIHEHSKKSKIGINDLNCEPTLSNAITAAI